jgi:hypothetical protein
MSHRKRLVISAVAFAVLWTGFMLWWSAPLEMASTIILVVTGAILGLLWYWLFGLWYRRRHFGA